MEQKLYFKLFNVQLSCKYASFIIRHVHQIDRNYMTHYSITALIIHIHTLEFHSLTFTRSIFKYFISLCLSTYTNINLTTSSD